MRLTPRPNAFRAAALALLSAAPGACAAYGENDPAAPAWFKARAEALEDTSFPKLTDVPQPRPRSRPSEEWAAIEQSLAADQAALEGSQRALGAPPAQAAAEFEAEARDAVQERPIPAADPAPLAE